MKIVHVISNLHIGGAEMLLKNTINLLPEHEHFIIYLEKPDDLLKQINFIKEAVCLHHSSWRQIFLTIKKIRQLLAKWKPNIVHAHLFESTLITRLAVPDNVPLVSTIHSTYSIDAFQKNWKAVWAERFTVNRQNAIIAVSKIVLNDYLKHVPFKGKSYVLHNFIPGIGKKEHKKDFYDGVLRCVAVGNLKEAKNYAYLLEVFKYLKEQEVTLDIYGDGPLRQYLQEQIANTNIKVNLCGTTNHIEEKLVHYDLFMQASKHEGYGIAVVEAMALKIPVFISDIPVFKEITDGNAFFFSLEDAKAAAAALMKIKTNTVLLAQVAQEGYHYIQSVASEHEYKKKLENIYYSILSNKMQM
jgi:glycosyltransferase involved in cell wall biosynthesis